MKILYKWIRKPLVLLALVLLIVLLFQQINILPKFSNWFKSKPLLIDNTPLVIKEIKSMALLNTATMYQEIVVDSTVSTTIPAPIINPFGGSNTTVLTKRLVLIVKGRVTAGVNFKNMNDSSIFVNGDSVRIMIPQATVSDVFINPSDIETFYEKGSWNNDEVIGVKLLAQKKLLAEAERQQLLKKANIKASAVILQFLQLAKFKKITII
jgi:hypothetical protein